MLSRRDLIRAAMLLGGATCAASALKLRAYAGDRESGTRPSLGAEQLELVATLAELIIPATDTLGARGAEVHKFIGEIYSRIFSADERRRFLEGLSDVDARARRSGAGFLRSSADAQREVLSRLSSEAASHASPKETPPFFSTLKEMTLLGYYTSEIGASQELKYVHGTGRFDGDIPFAEVGRAYSAQ